MTGWGLLLEGQVAVYKYWSRDSMTGGGGIVPFTGSRFFCLLSLWSIYIIANAAFYAGASCQRFWRAIGGGEATTHS